ncbi:MAG: cyclic nucleotide-binding domain-containing protein [Alphaproteobacteria bacterium]|nr:cyclic nucleotide-binding domain-containing protein [Alphaproteobacteria bacterium]
MTTSERSYRPGQVIFSEGASGDFAYLVRDGQVELLADRDNGRVRIATLGPGSLLASWRLSTVPRAWRRRRPLNRRRAA